MSRLAFRRAPASYDERFTTARFRVDGNVWRASFFPVLRGVDRLGGRRLEFLRYRLCLRGVKER